MRHHGPDGAFFLGLLLFPFDRIRDVNGVRGAVDAGFEGLDPASADATADAATLAAGLASASARENVVPI